MRFHSSLAFVLLLFLVSMVGCSSSEATPDTGPKLTPITLMLNWFPDAQHGGYYAAKLHGYFEAEGLDVTIVPGGPNAPVVQSVAMHQVEFGVGNADQILIAREQDAKVQVVMAPLQNSPRCIMVHQKSGISRFDQLENITLALGSGKAFAQHLQSKVRLKNVKIVPYTGNVAQFLADESFAQQGYVFSEPHVVEKNGATPHCLMVSELGFNPYTSCLFTHESMTTEYHDLVWRMVRASRLGWIKYLKEPEETNRVIVKENSAMDMDSLEYAVKSILPLCAPDESPLHLVGRMNEERWRSLGRQLEALKLMKSEDDAQNGFTLQFLDRL